MASTLAALISICHGAGPLAALQHPGHASLINSLTEDVPSILKLATAGAEKHSVYYDYFGFAKESYSITHDAEGAPRIAQRALTLLKAAEIDAKVDLKRGWDHGTFIPMKLIDPKASVPIVQISVLASQDARELVAMGAAVSRLREENVAIIGSRSPSYHNVRDWMSGRVARDRTFHERQGESHTALEAALQQKDEQKRTMALLSWRSFPHSFEMHPRGNAEHFSTLLVCAGAAKDAEVHCSRVLLMGAEQCMCW